MRAQRPSSSLPHRVAVQLAAIGAMLVIVPGASTATQSSESNAPYRLLWPDSPANPRPIERRTEVGLVYPPEVLAALIAAHPPEVVAPRIVQAVREGAVIVVLWEFPESSGEEPAQRPYRVRVREREQSGAGVPPLWIQQNAAGLEELDSRISTPVERPGSGHGVGVMAAFPRDAFVPGRIVYLRSQPVRTDLGRMSSHARYGAIDPALIRLLR